MTVTVNNSISEQEATALLSELAQVESLDALVLSGHNRRTPRMALGLDTGHHYVIETSANLRSCVCAEALTLTEDAALYRFYRRFIEHLFTQQGATA